MSGIKYHLFVCSIFLHALAFACFAQEGSDFEISIDRQFSIWRNSATSTSLMKNGDLIFPSSQKEDLGPITDVATTSSSVFAKCIGLKKRGLTKSDKFQIVDKTQIMFFEIDKRTNAVNGPFTTLEFNSRYVKAVSYTHLTLPTILLV